LDFVLIGGMAGVVHGSNLTTDDIDICVAMSEGSAAAIIAALSDLSPHFHAHPKRIPLPTDPAVLAGFKNLVLKTDLGRIDILTEVSGLGHFSDVKAVSQVVQIGDLRVKVLTLEALIVAKLAVGRPKDLRAVSILQTIQRIRQEKEPQEPS
jgi:hypothetical protein